MLCSEWVPARWINVQQFFIFRWTIPLKNNLQLCRCNFKKVKILEIVSKKDYLKLMLVFLLIIVNNYWLYYYWCIYRYSSTQSLCKTTGLFWQKCSAQNIYLLIIICIIIIIAVVVVVVVVVVVIIKKNICGTQITVSWSLNIFIYMQNCKWMHIQLCADMCYNAETITAHWLPCKSRICWMRLNLIELITG